MAYPDTFNAKLKLSCSQLAVAWLKDVSKSSEEKGWAKSNLVNLNGQVDEYLTIALQGEGITVDTEFATFKTAVEAALPDAYLAFTSGQTYTPPVPDVKMPYLTRLAFLNRFTNAELVSLYTLANTNVQIKIYLDKLMTAQYVDPARQDTRDGVQFLETNGLIAAGRALEILDAEIQDIERYTPGY